MSLTDDYLRDVLSRLPVSGTDRARIESDLRNHLYETVAAGATEVEAISRMGPPDEVAAELMATLTPLYAPPSSRLGAMMFDCMLIYSCTALIGIGTLSAWVRGAENASGEPGFTFLMVPLTLAIISLLPLVYFVLLEWLTGRTVGKWLFGLVVTDETGDAPSFASALVRRLSIFLAPAFAIDGAVMLVTAKRQRASELVAHTLVLSVPEGSPPVVGWIAVVALTAVVATTAFMLFSRFAGAWM